MKSLFPTLFTLVLSFLLVIGQKQQKNTSQPLGKHKLEDENGISISLSNYKTGAALTRKTTFAPTSSLTISVIDIPLTISFLLLQVHTYQYNITLSYDEVNLNKVSNRSLFGSNIGLYVTPQDGKPTQLFLKNDNVRTVEALLAVIAYSNEAPIPGGCNMEFAIEIAPYQKLFVNDSIVIVDSQPASLPTMDKISKSCEEYTVHQDVYRVYLKGQDFSSESYFDAIGSMLTVEDIIRNGQKIPPPIVSSPYRRIYSNYYGIGSVYAAIATNGNWSSAYVPIFSYGCNYVSYPEGCQFLNNALSNVICSLMFFAGCMCVFLGNKLPKMDHYMIQIFFGGAVTYIVMKLVASCSEITILGISIGGSFICLIIFTIIDAYFNIKSIPFTTVFSFGCLWSSLGYFCVNDSSIILENDWVFWLTYLSNTLIVLTMVVLLPLCPIVASTLLGSFMVVLSIDYFAGSCLKYIVINVIRRLTTPYFNYAIISPPFGSLDTALILFWIVLALIRIKRQFYGHFQRCSVRRRSNEDESTFLIHNYTEDITH